MPSIAQLSQRHLGATDPVALRIVRAQGNHVWDADGRQYLDFLMGWCVGNLGWSPPEIRRAVERFDGPDYVWPHAEYGPWGELATLLCGLAPGRMSTCYRATGGTEAVDIALQLAMAATGRHHVVSIQGSYHGNSVATRAATHSEEAASFGSVMPGTSLAPPLDGKALRRVETALKGRRVAAFLMEPVSCNLGALAPSQDFMEGVRHLCDRYGTLLVLDEVACGFGRTGRLFATEHFGVAPDLLCLGKAITSGVAPMGATLATKEVVERAQGMQFYSTYGWHPRSTAAALATVRHWKAHHGRVLRNVRDRARQFEQRLLEVFEEDQVRVRGLAIGVHGLRHREGRRIATRCRKAGLLLDGDDDALKMFPALTLDEATADEGLDVLGKSR